MQHMLSQKGDFNTVENKNSLKKELVCIIAVDSEVSIS
jgi:hypothetical protein